MAENTNNIVYRIEVDSESGKINVDGVTKSFEQADKAFLKLQKDVSKGIPKATKSLKGLGDASGSATSATMELSRVISDAPYGIRGMANNITQLVSQMGTATEKAGGFGEALKLMGAQMMGSLGVVFLITAAVAALDYFYGANKKAEEGVKSFRKEVEELNTTLLKQADHTKLASESIDEYLKLLIKRKEIEKQLSALADKQQPLEEGVENLKKALKTFKEKLAADEDNVFLQNKVIELDKLIESEQTKINILYRDGQEILDDYNESKDNLTKAQEGTVKALELEKNELKKVQKEVAKSPAVWKTYEAAIQSVQDKIDAITGGKDGKMKKVSYFDFKELQIGNGKYLKEIMKVEEKTTQLRTKSKIGSLEIQRHYHLQRLGKATGANKELIAAYEKYYDDLIRLEEEKLLGKSKIDPKKPKSAGATPDEIKEKQRLETETRLEALMEASNAIGGFLDGEYSREITREQNKTNALNNELRERLNNENLSKSERKSIQLEIARNDEALRIKQEVLEKKRFKTQKAINISQALLSTYLAAAQVQANPLLIDPLTKGIAMGATIATGLANVATIARQKFQSSAGATSTAGSLGGGGGGGNDRSFNFNLAGASRENQLANALQGRFDQPLQAFVVSRDITNAQQLDADIRTNASFG